MPDNRHHFAGAARSTRLEVFPGRHHSKRTLIKRGPAAVNLQRRGVRVFQRFQPVGRGNVNICHITPAPAGFRVDSARGSSAHSELQHIRR